MLKNMEVLVEKINNNEFKVSVKSKQETIHFVDSLTIISIK